MFGFGSKEVSAFRYLSMLRDSVLQNAAPSACTTASLGDESQALRMQRYQLDSCWPYDLLSPLTSVYGKKRDVMKVGGF